MVDVSNWVAAGAACVAALMAGFSALNASKQNKLAIHQHKVNAYREFVEAFMNGLDIDCNKITERSQAKLRFGNACEMIRFLYEVDSYKLSDNLFDDFDQFDHQKDLKADARIRIETHTDNIWIEFYKTKEAECAQEVNNFRPDLLEQFKKCRAAMASELTLRPMRDGDKFFADLSRLAIRLERIKSRNDVEEIKMEIK